MMRKSSSRRNREEAHEMAALLEEIDEIEVTLGPLQGAQAASLQSQTEDTKRKLETLDEEELSSFRLAFLRKEISKLRAKAEELANNSFVASTSSMHDQLDEIEKTLEPIEGADAEALRSQLEDQKNQLESVDKEKLSSLQAEVLALREKADTLSTKSFLLHEIGLIEKMLGSAKRKPFIKRSELESLEKEKDDKRKRLQSAAGNELASLRKDVNKLKENTDAFVAREGWRARLGRVSALIWLGTIPFLILLYSGWVASWQWRVQPTIQTLQMQTAIANTATAAVMQTATAAVMQTVTAQALPPAIETPPPTPTP